MSAVSSPHTNAPAPMRSSRSKSKSALKEVLAEQSVLVGLLDGDLEAFDGQRILGADVDEAAVGAHGVGADDHAFDHAVRIAFEHRRGS